MDAFLPRVTYSRGGRRGTMEGDILAYLNQKEFPTCTYPRSSWTLSSSFSRSARLSVCLSLLVVGQTSRRSNTLNCGCRGCDRCPSGVGM